MVLTLDRLVFCLLVLFVRLSASSYVFDQNDCWELNDTLLFDNTSLRSEKSPWSLYDLAAPAEFLDKVWLHGEGLPWLLNESAVFAEFFDSAIVVWPDYLLPKVFSNNSIQYSLDNNSLVVSELDIDDRRSSIAERPACENESAKLECKCTLRESLFYLSIVLLGSYTLLLLTLPGFVVVTCDILLAECDGNDVLDQILAYLQTIRAGKTPKQMLNESKQIGQRPPMLAIEAPRRLPAIESSEKERRSESYA